MPFYVEFACRCGHLVRATADQGGTDVRCWHCGQDVHIPSPRAVNTLVARFAAAAGETLSPRSLGALLVATVGMMVTLMIPILGNPIAFIALIVGARLYQELIRDNAPPSRATDAEDEARYSVPEWAAWGLSILAAMALMAPFLVRSWIHLLPIAARMRPALVLASFCGWLVVPLILYAFNAHERHGDVPPRQALFSLVRLPMTSLLTLMLLPLGFCIVEASTVLISAADDFLAVLLENLYPVPLPILVGDHPAMKYRFDDLTTTVLVGNESSDAKWVYLMALRRGYTLAGMIPITLSHGLEAELGFPQHESLDPVSLFKRMILTSLIVAFGLLILSLQARWFGQVAWLATRDARKRPSPPVVPSLPTPVPTVGAVPASSPPPVSFSTTVPPLAPVSPPVIRPSATATVLIVDGDREYALGLGRVLSDRGFGVVVASSAREAQAMAQGAKPDAVILDTELPDRSGIDLCRDLRQNHAGARPPVLIATSPTATAAVISAMASTADDYLVKPYVVEALIVRLKQRLQSRV